MPSFQKSKYLLPSIFTVANMLFGFYSIIAALNQKWLVAGAVLTFATVMDGLDGRVARYTKTTSEFGLNFDSLVDAVSFGVAPALVIYLRWLTRIQSFAGFAWVLAFLYVTAGTIRLARFNIFSHQSLDKAQLFFRGLPIPAASSLLSTGVWVHAKYQDTYPTIVSIIPKCIPVLMIILTYLMISKLRYFSFKKFGFFKRHPVTSSIVCGVVLLFLVLCPALTFFCMAAGYVLSGIVLKIYMLRKLQTKTANIKKGDV